MKTNDFINILEKCSFKGSYPFRDASEARIPTGFHVIDAGVKAKNLIDQWGNLKHTHDFSFKLWHGNGRDSGEGLVAEKFLPIIYKILDPYGSPNLNVEVEYEGNTLEVYGLSWAGSCFMLCHKDIHGRRKYI